MVTVRQTAVFREWAASLGDGRAKARIAMRISRMERGLLGDVKWVGGTVSEARIDYGPGYRLYFTRRGQVLVILLCGGTKDSQPRDIASARAMAADLEE